MEKELVAYKKEIEKRYQKSTLKGFAFPRTETRKQDPLSFLTFERGNDLQNSTGSPVFKNNYMHILE